MLQRLSTTDATGPPELYFNNHVSRLIVSFRSSLLLWVNDPLFSVLNVKTECEKTDVCVASMGI